MPRGARGAKRATTCATLGKVLARPGATPAMQPGTLSEFRAETARAADLGIWFNSRANAEGLVVADLAAEGAIAKIGFQEGDRIVSINGQPASLPKRNSPVCSWLTIFVTSASR